MGRAAAVLSGPRLVLAAVLGGALGAYYATSESWWNASTWWDVAFLALVLVPAVFALVYLALPALGGRGLFWVGLSLVVLAVLLEVADLGAAAGFAKLAAATAIAFWFLDWFENVRWVALVAVLVPWVDAYSVWRGPTKHVLEGRREIFTTLSFAFPVPGEHASANLGVPDLLFFALFLAAAARFGLRPFWTWLAMTLSFGATMALAVWWDVAGLPALPLLCVGFVGVNADRIWAAFRRHHSDQDSIVGETPSSTSSSGGSSSGNSV